MKPAEKFHIFHQRHLWKSSNAKESGSSAEYPVVAAAHSEQNASVMRKAVRQSINEASRQANPEVTANNVRIIHNARDLIQTSRRHFGIDMHKPKDFTAGDASASIHLHGPIAFTSDKLITKIGSEINGAIRASTVCNDDFGASRALAKMLKKWSY
jgi:hypothetical protein